jgi:hypothetical protein
VDRIIDACRKREHRRQRLNEPRADVAREAVGTAEEHRTTGAESLLVGSVQGAELIRRDAVRARLAGDEVVPSAADERQVTGREREKVLACLRPEPGVALDHRVHGELDPGQPQPPRRDRGGPGEHPSRRARPDQMLLQEIHTMSVPHNKMSVNSIDPLNPSADHGHMDEAASQRVLVLGATGKSGSRVARKRSQRGRRDVLAVAGTQPVSIAEFAAGAGPPWK